ncbi:MAG: hypothetical protein HY340_03770 [Candidatus Kerfeldbacteria bacterium]|nr:hypothetical protein [Candidatus Kerfeldbacteria bacterium]
MPRTKTAAEIRRSRAAYGVAACGLMVLENIQTGGGAGVFAPRVRKWYQKLRKTAMVTLVTNDSSALQLLAG